MPNARHSARSWQIAFTSSMRRRQDTTMECCSLAASGMRRATSSRVSTGIHGEDVARSRMSGWTNGTEGRVSEPYCFAQRKLKLSLAAALRLFWPHTLFKPQASMSAWATRGSTRSKASRRVTPRSSTSKPFGLHRPPRSCEPRPCSVEARQAWRPAASPLGCTSRRQSSKSPQRRARWSISLVSGADKMQALERRAVTSESRDAC